MMNQDKLTMLFVQLAKTLVEHNNPNQLNKDTTVQDYYVSEIYDNEKTTNNNQCLDKRQQDSVL